MQPVDYVGRMFGRLRVVARDLTRSDDRNHWWICRCDCGSKRAIRGSSLRAGMTVSCGCYRSETLRRPRPARRDVIGLVFGLWIVREKRGLGKYLCACSCGTERVLQIGTLTTGRSKSCGCAFPSTVAARFTKHGHTAGVRRTTHGTKEYRAWKDAKARCHNTTHRWYRYYGAKGVRMCDRWRDNFQFFMDDMGPCPTGLTLDRIDPFGNYEPGNCRWATWEVQHKNTRRAAARST